MDQLKENIASHKVKLSKETLKAIDEINEDIPNPAP